MVDLGGGEMLALVTQMLDAIFIPNIAAAHLLGA